MIPGDRVEKHYHRGGEINCSANPKRAQANARCFMRRTTNHHSAFSRKNRALPEIGKIN
jgi:hypothetical protein